MSNRIILLGGCHHIGQHLLVPEIIGEDDCVVDGSQIVGKMGKKMVLWFLEQNKEKIDSDSIVRKAYAYKEQQEKLISWPSLIPGCINLAQGSETYVGMQYKLRQYLTHNERPDVVLITDVGNKHRGVVVNDATGKYVCSQEIGLLGRQQGTLPDHIYSKAVEKIKQQEVHGEAYQKKKSKRSYEMLAKTLRSLGITYRFLVVQDYNKYIADDYIDLNPFYRQYTDEQENQVISKKRKAQTDIADYVKSKLYSI